MTTPENHKMQILIRKDLTMRKGKMIAQGSHAVLELSHAQTVPRFKDLFSLAWWKQRKQFYHWYHLGQKKIGLSVDSEAELIKMRDKFLDAGIPVHLVIDEGLTEFNGVHTLTCLAAGPAPSEHLVPITGNLKPL